MAFEYVPYGGPVVTRAEAKSAGQRRYFTAQACKSGHTAERLVSNKTCVACLKTKLDVWRVQNPEKLAAVEQARKARDADAGRFRHRERYAQNANRLREQMRDYRRANPDICKAAAKRWTLANPERLKATKAAWAKRNAEFYRANARNQRARRKKAVGRHTQAEVTALFDRQGGRCANSACKAKIASGFHVDHVQPIKLGGTNFIANIQLLCPSCNCSKGAKDPFVWAQSLGRLL